MPELKLTLLYLSWLLDRMKASGVPARFGAMALTRRPTTRRLTGTFSTHPEPSDAPPGMSDAPRRSRSPQGGALIACFFDRMRHAHGSHGGLFFCSARCFR